MRPRWSCLWICILLCSAVFAQDRPLVTEKTDTVPLGRIRTELGFDFLQNAVYRVSGLEGDLTRLAVISLRIGAGKKAEIHLFWTAQQFLNVSRRFPAPNSHLLDFSGNSTSDVGDLFMETKLRFADESGRRPAFGLQFGVQLPNASNERGLGNDETNFFSALLVQKHLRQLTLIGNAGLAILGDPLSPGAQDDLLTYGLAAEYPVSSEIALMGDWYGRTGPGGYGTEDQSRFRLGARINAAGLYWDAALLVGFLDTDPSTGLIVGISKDFSFPFLR